MKNIKFEIRNENILRELVRAILNFQYNKFSLRQDMIFFTKADSGIVNQHCERIKKKKYFLTFKKTERFSNKRI